MPHGQVRAFPSGDKMEEEPLDEALRAFVPMRRFRVTRHN
jgi:hypothetical protein